MTTTISAIIPTYNRLAWISRSIESILNQSLQPNEIIVVDDGSTDGTANLLRRRYGQRVRLIQQSNGGVSAARRTGILSASADWVAFLDSDDEWLPGRLCKMAHLAERTSPDVACIFGDTLMRGDIDESSLFTEHGLNAPDQPIILANALATQFPFMFSLLGSSLIRRSALMATGAFNEGLRSSEDFLVSFRLAMNFTFAVIPEAVTRAYRTQDLSASSLDARKSSDEDCYRARMIAFREAQETLGGSWGKHYEHAARRLTQVRMACGRTAHAAAFEQFRFGLSLRSIRWAVAALASDRLHELQNTSPLPG